MDLAPNHHYYSTLAGEWSARFSFEVRDWSVFWSRPMSLFNRFRVISMVVSAKIIGAPRIETIVDYRGDQNEVHHQLAIRKWGLTFYRSNEVLSLDADGRSLHISGEQRMFPFIHMGSPEDLGDAPGTINETGTGAHYTLQWLGGPLEIRTQMVDGGADIDMNTGWGGGVQPLRAKE